MSVPQRQDYLAGKVSHEEYYRSIAKMAGISFRNSEMLHRVKDALYCGDKRLNGIPLRH